MRETLIPKGTGRETRIGQRFASFAAVNFLWRNTAGDDHWFLMMQSFTVNLGFSG